MIDVGARFHDAALSLTANAFLRSMGDLVIDTRVSDTLYRKVNVGEARIYGVEFTGEINPWSSVVAYTSLSLVRGEDTGNGTDLPQMPPLSGRAGVRFPLTGFAFIDAFTSFAADQDAVADGEARTPGYVLFHLQARSTQIRVGGVGFQLVAAVDNIFDRSWRRHLSTLRGLIISEPGRNMSLRLRLLW
jgi:hemoglobin/transferrin/lactoferrin receptor protein